MNCVPMLLYLHTSCFTCIELGVHGHSLLQPESAWSELTPSYKKSGAKSESEIPDITKVQRMGNRMGNLTGEKAMLPGLTWVAHTNELPAAGLCLQRDISS